MNIGIVRKGSALDTRWVSFGMVPSGEKKSLATIDQLLSYFLGGLYLS